MQDRALELQYTRRVTTYARANDRLDRSSGHRARYFPGSHSAHNPPIQSQRYRCLGRPLRENILTSTMEERVAICPGSATLDRSFHPIEPDRANVFPFTSFTVAYGPGSPLKRLQREPRLDKYIRPGHDCPSRSPFLTFPSACRTTTPVLLTHHHKNEQRYYYD
jgi:hypothetical protein